MVTYKDFVRFYKDEFVTDDHLSELLERLGILTLKVGQSELPIFKEAESARHDVKLFPGVSKAWFQMYS